MTIAVDTRFLAAARIKAGSGFDRDSILQFAIKNPNHHFLFISDKPFDAQHRFPKNVTLLTTGPQVKNSLLMQYWFNYKLPALLRKHKADVFVAPDGICSLRTKVPQCLIIPDTSFISAPAYFSKPNTRFYKKNMRAFINKAKTVATFSEFSKAVLVDHYKTGIDKIEVTRDFFDETFSPLNPDEKEIVKETYAGGKEYFLCAGSNNPRSNLLNLLKAFSFFKRRQKSNMLLLIAGDPGEAFKNDLKTYKFRNEVKLLTDLTSAELAKITAAAYSVVHPVLYEDSGLILLQAMRCQVPVITGNIGALPEVCGEAALYANVENFEEIAQKMMLVFKDEDTARKMIKTGIEKTAHFHSGRSLWSLIKKAANG